MGSLLSTVTLAVCASSFRYTSKAPSAPIAGMSRVFTLPASGSFKKTIRKWFLAGAGAASVRKRRSGTLQEYRHEGDPRAKNCIYCPAMAVAEVTPAVPKKPMAGRSGSELIMLVYTLLMGEANNSPTPPSRRVWSRSSRKKK